MSARAKQLQKLGIYDEVMWHERFKEDFDGDFKQQKAALEKESLEQVFDRWCRGQNLLGFSSLILDRVELIKGMFK